MSIETLNLKVVWHKPRWYHFNRYLRGEITSTSNVPIKAIHRKDSGQLRISTREKGWPLDGVSVSVNGETAVTVSRRGSHGRLHIWNPS